MDLICSDRAQDGLALSGPIAGGAARAAATADKVLSMILMAAGKVAFFARRLNWSCKKRLRTGLSTGYGPWSDTLHTSYIADTVERNHEWLLSRECARVAATCAVESVTE